MKKALLWAASSVLLLAGLVVILVGPTNLGSVVSFGLDEGGDGEPELRPNAGSPEPPSHLDRPVSTSAYADGDDRADHGPSDGVRIRIVEKGNGRRLPGAEVLFLDPALIDRAVLDDAFLSGGRDLESILRRFGRRYRADRNGELRVPRFREQAGVLARYGELSRVQELHHGMDDPVLLELDLGASLVMQVVDEAGSPIAGVPLTLRQGSGEAAVDVWRGSSAGAEALAEVPNVRRLIEGFAADGGAPLVLGFGVPIDPPIEVRLDPDAIPSDPVRLVLPRTGRVVLSLRDLDGAPVRGGALVSLQVLRSDSGDQGYLHGALVNHPVRVEDGRAVFPFVGLGLRLRAEAWRGDRIRPVARDFDGPTASAAVVELELAFAERVPVVVGRAVDESGRALRSCALQTTVRARGGGLGSFGGPVMTDEEGRFAVVIKGDATASEGRELEVAVRPPGPGSPRHLAVTNLPRTLPGGETDLGNVILRPAPLLVEGVVVDDAGRPVRGAAVAVDVHPVGSAPDSGFVADVGLRAVADDEGRFAVHGLAGGVEVRVTASRERYLPAESQIVAIGARGVRCVLRRGGVIEGLIATDTGIRPGDVQVVLAPASAEAAPSRTLRPGNDGRFRFPSCPPGRWRIGVRVAETTEIVPLVDDLRVFPAEVVDDPRLRPLDLRGRLRALEFSVVDGQGRAIPEVRGVARRSGTEAPGAAARALDGLLRLVVGPSPVTVEITAEGYRPAVLEAVSEGRRVSLQRGLALRLSLSGGATPPSSPLELQVALARVDLPPGDVSGRVATEPKAFDRGGDARVVVPFPGRYRASFSVARRGGIPGAAIGLRSEDTVVFVVEETSDEQAVPLRLSPASLAEALAELER